MAALLLPLVLATVVATAFLWPSSHRPVFANPLGAPTELVKAEVTDVQRQPCQADANAGTCMNVSTLVTSGTDNGQDVSLVIPEGPGQPDLSSGDRVLLGRTEVTPGQVTYYFSDFQRGQGLATVAALFAVLVVGVARWRGLGALVGLIITYAVLTQFMLPAILDGRSPLAVAISGASLIVLVVLYIAHGFNARTTTAVIGTLLSMVVVAVLATVGVAIAHITGLSSEEATYVQSFAGDVNIKGLLLGGMVIGAIGVLNDMTVTQASAVWEIHRAQPQQSRTGLYRSAMRVGRDHIASTTYTLVLAYTGAALPLFIVFTLADRSFSQVVTSDLVGEEVIRTLIGGIGLILSVPITTALAAIVAKAQPVRAVAAPAASIDPSDEIVPAPMLEIPAPYEDLPGAGDNDQAAEQASERGEQTSEPGQQDARSASDAEQSRPHDSDGDGAAPISPTPTPIPPIDEIHTDPTPYEQEALEAVTSPLPTKRRGMFRRRRSTVFEGSRKMSRRERKFWEED